MGYYKVSVNFPTKLFKSQLIFCMQSLGETEALKRACADCGYEFNRTFVPLNPVTAKEALHEIVVEIDAQNRIAEGRATTA